MIVAAAILLVSPVLSDTCSLEQISADNPRLVSWHKQLLAQLSTDKTVLWLEVLPDSFEADLLLSLCGQWRETLRMDSAISVLESVASPGFQTEVSRVVTERRSLSKLRDSTVLESVPSSHRVHFQAILNPPRPQVFHFGTHDRLNCVVCIPGTPINDTP